MEKSYFLNLKNFLDFLCTRGIKSGVSSGMSAAIFTESGSMKTGVTSFSGKSRFDEDGIKIDETFYFDLASLTKPLSTTLILFSLFEEGLLDWQTIYADVIERKIPHEKRKINIGQLLSHSSGLLPYKPYFKCFKPDYNNKKRNKEKIIDLILTDPLKYKPGSDCQYSDFGFILLGDLIEQLTGKSLDILFMEKITKPLGLEKEIFFPSIIKNYGQFEKKCLATEQCLWRNRIVHGEIHDEHCFLMGGVAGHAGLFGTLKGVMAICESILKKWQGGRSKLPVSRDTFKFSLKKKYPDRSWCMGFDTPSKGYTSAGKYMSEKAVGHLGYCGTSFWIDPFHKCIIVLLTNRVHPNRNNMKIKEFRPWFHEQVMKYMFHNGQVE